jgi:hypothetical protein
VQLLAANYSAAPRQWHTLPRSSSPMSKQSKLFFPSSMTCSCSMKAWVLSGRGECLGTACIPELQRYRDHQAVSRIHFPLSLHLCCFSQA